MFTPQEIPTVSPTLFNTLQPQAAHASEWQSDLSELNKQAGLEAKTSKVNQAIERTDNQISPTLLPSGASVSLFLPNYCPPYAQINVCSRRDGGTIDEEEEGSQKTKKRDRAD